MKKSLSSMNQANPQTIWSDMLTCFLAIFLPNTKGFGAMSGLVSVDSVIWLTWYNLCSLDNDYCLVNHFEFEDSGTFGLWLDSQLSSHIYPHLNVPTIEYETSWSLNYSGRYIFCRVFCQTQGIRSNIWTTVSASLVIRQTWCNLYSLNDDYFLANHSKFIDLPKCSQYIQKPANKYLGCGLVHGSTRLCIHTFMQFSYSRCSYIGLQISVI